MQLGLILYEIKQAYIIFEANSPANLMLILICFELKTLMDCCTNGLLKNVNFVIKINDNISTMQSDEGQLISIKRH